MSNEKNNEPQTHPEPSEPQPLPMFVEADTPEEDMTQRTRRRAKEKDNDTGTADALDNDGESTMGRNDIDVANAVGIRRNGETFEGRDPTGTTHLHATVDDSVPAVGMRAAPPKALDLEALREEVAAMVWDSHPMAHDMEGEDGEEPEPGVSWEDVKEWEGMDERVFACRHAADRILALVRPLLEQLYEVSDRLTGTRQVPERLVEYVDELYEDLEHERTAREQAEWLCADEYRRRRVLGARVEELEAALRSPDSAVERAAANLRMAILGHSVRDMAEPIVAYVRCDLKNRPDFDAAHLVTVEQSIRDALHSTSSTRNYHRLEEALREGREQWERAEWLVHVLCSVEHERDDLRRMHSDIARRLREKRRVILRERDARERAEESRDLACAENARLIEHTDIVEARADAAERRLAGLLSYTTHRETCPESYTDSMGKPCNCGLAALLEPDSNV